MTQLPSILTVSVTQKDIDAGCKRSAFSCPVARAVARTLGRGYRHNVGATQHHINVYDSVGNVQVYKNPENLTQFIRQFDAGTHTVYPTTFWLTLETKGEETEA